MPRIHRTYRGPRARPRRRHRTWMLSMTLASLGWGCWWLDLLLMRTVPDLVPSVAVVGTLASAFALAGLVAAVLTLRGRNRVWLGMALIPLFANASLLSVPWLVDPSQVLGAR